jgi:hypothetical protein
MSMPETGQWMNGTSLLAILRLPLRRLESFSIALNRLFWMNWNWNSFSSEMKDTLLNIVHSSTLKTLSLTGLIGMPISLFFDIAHLATLELHSLLPEDFDGENSSSLTQPASKGMAPMDSNAAIDRRVWHLQGSQVNAGYKIAYFSLTRDRRSTNELILLPFLCRLRFLEIYIIMYSPSNYDFNIFKLTILMDLLCISLNGTLEHLDFNIWYHDDDHDVDHPFYENLRDAWTHLDAITTHSTGLLWLPRVDININYSFCYQPYDGDEQLEFYEDELLKSVLEGLPLLRTKGILFVKVNMVDEYYESDDS